MAVNLTEDRNGRARGRVHRKLGLSRVSKSNDHVGVEPVTYVRNLNLRVAIPVNRLVQSTRVGLDRIDVISLRRQRKAARRRTALVGLAGKESRVHRPARGHPVLATSAAGGARPEAISASLT